MSRLGKREIIRQIMLFDDESGGSVIGGDIDRLKEMDIEDLRDTYREIYNEEAKKKSSTKKNTKVASLRSPKDKKFMGHTGRG
tara:strand:+ start:277 stop:525 length:249 start_codon:yes stop_codon:yes gene_type:complete